MNLKPPLLRRVKPRAWPLWMLLPVLLLNSGCASESVRYLPTQSPAIPPLPIEARQGDPSSICLPTCSAGLSKDQDSWLPLPTGPDGRQPASLAEAIVAFVETQGAAWGARRDVVSRAAAAALEAAEAIGAAGQGRGVTSIRGSFDEFNLDLELLHSGPRLNLAASGAAPADLLDGDDEAFERALDAAMSGVSAVLLQRLADRLSTGERDGQAFLRLHFDH